ncbi:DUF3558 family protein [Lentzea sp. NPDC051838]|uniref:DUF3558 family protein n=1 Tax=Lentzea sp. NPDC051838 TaxID=3154849 RepID=UPI0034237A70
MNTSRLAVLAVAFGLSGCSILVPSFGEEPSSTPASPPAAAKTEEAEALPSGCDLFEPDEFTLYRFTVETSRDEDGCTWRTDFYEVVSVHGYDGATPERLQVGRNSETSEITVGGHTAMLAKRGISDTRCGVLFKVGDGTVSVSATSDELAKSCAIAQAVATDVEPRLP